MVKIFPKFVFFMKITDFKLKFPSKKYHENSYVQPGWRSLSLKSDKSMVISNFKCRKYPISTWNRQKKLSKFQKCKKTTDLPDLKSWRKRSFRLAVQKSNQVQIPGLRFYVLTVMMCFNSPLTDFYHTSTTRIEPLNHLWEYFLAECQKLEILFSIFTDFFKVISKLSKGL